VWGGKEGGYLQTGRGLMYCMQYDMTLFTFGPYVAGTGHKYSISVHLGDRHIQTRGWDES